MKIEYPPTKSDTFIENLRAKTAQSHKDLESLPVSGSIMAAKVTKSDYAHYLGLMHDIVKSTEAYIFPVLAGIIPNLDERRKRTKIENDLKTIGIPKKNTSAVFDGKYSVAFALGIMYVVEGSSLGGRFIMKNIAASLDYDEANGASYFAGYGSKTGCFWKNFLHYMIDYEAQTNSADEIIKGAAFAFDAIHNHFETNSTVT